MSAAMSKSFGHAVQPPHRATDMLYTLMWPDVRLSECMSVSPSA